MKIVKFKECNVVYAEDQEEYLPLPAHRTQSGAVTCCWKLSFTERLLVLFTGKIFLTVLTFNHPLQPQLASVFNLVKGVKESKPTTRGTLHDESENRKWFEEAGSISTETWEKVDPFCLEKKEDEDER